MRVESLEHVVSRKTRVLILGSMPGRVSLEQGRYYAHPRNRFWPLMGMMVGAGPGLRYPERLQRLARSGVGLWDVLARCVREGSLDGSIETGSEEPNDIPALLDRSPALVAIAFNGRKASNAFRRHLLSRLAPDLTRRLTLLDLPSTSPANASWSLDDLLVEWDRIRAHL